MRQRGWGIALNHSQAKRNRRHEEKPGREPVQLALFNPVDNPV